MAALYIQSFGYNVFEPYYWFSLASFPRLGFHTLTTEAIVCTSGVNFSVMMKDRLLDVQVIGVLVSLERYPLAGCSGQHSHPCPQIAFFEDAICAVLPPFFLPLVQ